MVPPLQFQKVVVLWAPIADNVAPLLTCYKHLPGGQDFGPHEAPMYEFFHTQRSLSYHQDVCSPRRRGAFQIQLCKPD